jgi:RNase P subunit RPR2
LYALEQAKRIQDIIKCRLKRGAILSLPEPSDVLKDKEVKNKTISLEQALPGRFCQECWEVVVPGRVYYNVHTESIDSDGMVESHDFYVCQKCKNILDK